MAELEDTNRRPSQKYRRRRARQDWEGDRNRDRDRDRHEEGQEEEIWNGYPEEHEEDRAGPTAEETDDWGDWGERVRHFATTDKSEGWGAAPVEEATPGVEIRKRPRRQGKGVKARKDSHKLQAFGGVPIRGLWHVQGQLLGSAPGPVKSHATSKAVRIR